VATARATFPTGSTTPAAFEKLLHTHLGPKASKGRLQAVVGAPSAWSLE
jgi:hypothetical protein